MYGIWNLRHLASGICHPEFMMGARRHDVPALVAPAAGRAGGGADPAAPADPASATDRGAFDLPVPLRQLRAAAPTDEVPGGAPGVLADALPAGTRLDVLPA